MACYDTLAVHNKVLTHFAGELHRPEYNYKFKFKFSGCPNDCTNSIMRSDMAVIGTWRDAIQVDDQAVREWIEEKGLETLVNQVVSLCPTRAITLEAGAFTIDHENCVRCMQCLNAMPRALTPGKQRGVTLLLGGKSALKMGTMLGSMIVPFMEMETEEDIERFIDLSERIIDWWNDNGFNLERIGETIERVGMKQFLDGVGLQASIDMVRRPRNNPYYKSEY